MTSHPSPKSQHKNKRQLVARLAVVALAASG